VGLGLLVIVAAQLPYFLRGAATWTWIVAQTVAMLWFMDDIRMGGIDRRRNARGAALGSRRSRRPVVLAISEGRRARTSRAPTRNSRRPANCWPKQPDVGTSAHLARSARHARPSPRGAEPAARRRGRLSEGKAAEHLQQAHAITRLLLSDVRDVVGTLRENSKPEPRRCDRALALQPACAQVHLDVPRTSSWTIPRAPRRCCGRCRRSSPMLRATPVPLIYGSGWSQSPPA
jgi:hypothetical protein